MDRPKAIALIPKKRPVFGQLPGIHSVAAPIRHTLFRLTPDNEEFIGRQHHDTICFMVPATLSARLSLADQVRADVQRVLAALPESRVGPAGTCSIWRAPVAGR